jgi:alpha-D-xyloside xylohydrolase
VNQSKVATQSGTEPVIGGFKTDDGETGNGTNTYIPTSAAYADGRTGIEMRNGYCIEYHKAVSSVLGPDGLLFARSGFTGTQQYPAGWSGDNEANFDKNANGLNTVMVAGQSAAMSGYSMWGHDIGGYQNANFENDRADLFMRWTQFGAFSPLMQMHRNVDPNNLQQYPWGYGTAALANYVAFAKLHTRLFPYIYTYAQLAVESGLPIIRPLVLTNQTDANTYALRHTYNFGNELLVAPMNAASSTSRNVYLPSGAWYDYWTNVRYIGGQNISWFNSDSTAMPLFVREGAIVPMLANIPQTLNSANYVNNSGVTTMDNGLLFLVYPAPTGTTYFNVYDGTNTECTKGGTVTTFTVSSAARPIILKVFTSPAPAGVERNGVRLPQLGTQADFNAASLGWYNDGTAGFLYVKFAHTGGSAVISFGPDTAGDGIPDSWRQYFFANATPISGLSDAVSDPDHDGFTNADEYRAGTNPQDAQSRLTLGSVTVQALENGEKQVVLTCRTQPGIHYQIQWNDELTSVWQLVLSDFVGDGTVMNWPDDGSQTSGPIDNFTRRFYRIAVP